MKTIFITSIAVFALTNAATAHSWMWFQGDIGIVSSPFVSSSSTNKVAAQTAIKKQAVQKPVVATSKSKSADQRITAR
jgi:hypothetical protein